MKISKSFYEKVEQLVPSAKPLSKGVIVEEMTVSAISEPQAFGDTAPLFLQGKHSVVVTGENAQGNTVAVSVVAEDMKGAMRSGGVELFHHEAVAGKPAIPAKGAKPAIDAVPATEEYFEIPDCTFAANGYNQVWSAL